ncbi:MAG TPA: serine/threonine-protein kinase PknK, partial [Polyangiaceae bacterium]|nr:serine/threonine-protein kinase PknK [Polyangiaceae bacterium]
RYELGELIAESERNTVRRARRLSDGRRVIIKTSARPYPTVRDLRKLAFEHHLLEKLAGPGIIEALGSERQSGRIALVLEDFGGERLPVRPNQGLELDTFFPLALGIVRALGQVHAKDVIHKDINPRNVLMNPSSGEVKLIDFSLSSELSREHPEIAAGTRLEGTLPYISPEQTGRMNRDVDYRSDYYSLGVTFFEILTGTQPFAASDMLGYVHCHLSKTAPSARERNAEVPEGLAAIVAKLMAKNPDERYQSARGLVADLEQCQKVFAERRDVPAFELGRHDVPERFGVSRELVGREGEIAELLAVFEAARSGPALLLLVSGYSGVGKSSLIREVHKPVVDRRASFISGKFEQLERNTPYGALAQALREHLRQMLAATEDQLLVYRTRLESALGINAGVLTALLPELAQILGAVPPVAELPAREARGRVQRSFRDLLRAIATAEHPLVMFLDDLQWTDGSTPQLLVRLLAEENLRHVLFIGAFRDNEVGENHLLSHALADLRAKRPDAIRQLSLLPLPESSVNQIVASTLRRDPSQTRPLAQLLFQKTAGNPFFLSELMTQLHREGAIRFDSEAGVWTSRDDAIARASYSDNVVDLMVRRLQRLPAETLECLRLGACLGNEFELGFLARVVKRGPEAVAAALWPAVEQRLLLPRGHDYQLLGIDAEGGGLELAGADVQYRFPHDRVHAAVYSLSDGQQRARAHLDIGRLLRDQIPAAERARRVFDFIDHLNLGRSLLEGVAQRDELAELDFVAAQRARRSAAYATAVAYLETSRELLTAAEWDSRRARQFEILRMRAECVFLSGQVERAHALAEELFGLAPDRAALASAYCLKAAILEQQSRLAESIATILRGLRELGVELPEEPAAIGAGIGAGIGKMKAHLDRVPIENLSKLSGVTDALQVATTELLFQLIPPASQLNPPLFILAELVLFDLALTHGTVPGSAKNFMDCGIVLGSSLGDYAGAYRMGKEAFTLLDRIVPTPLEAGVNFVFGCFISHWGAHFQEGLDALARAHQRGVELGDVLHASYGIIHRAKSLFFSGRDLAECQAQADRALAYTIETGSVGHVAVPRLVRRAVGQLTGQNQDSEDVALSDEAFTREIEKTENGHFLLVLGQSQTIVSFVLGDFERAAQASELATRFIGVGNGAFTVPDYHLFQALIAAQRWAQTSSEERPALLASIEANAATLEGFARVCPANFAHKHLLVRAELARLREGSIDAVLELHRQAQQAAGDDFVHLRAISYELLSAFWKDRGHPELARESLLEAYHLYRHWGAAQKLRRLEREHSDWLRRAHVPAIA